MRRVAGAMPLVLAVLLASCRQVAGITDRSTAEPPASCGTLESPLAGECAACVESACCDEAAACGDDPACHGAFACLAACAGDDDACRARCRSTQAAGFGDLLAALAGCQASGCAAACGLAAGGYAFPNAGCAFCARASCASQASACAADGECLALAFCTRACGDDDGCLSDCAAAHASGVNEDVAFGDCTDRSCSDACGAKWACIGSVTWPAPTGVSITVDLVVSDYQTAQPIAGLAVAACDRKDPLCAGALASGTTGSDGHVSLELHPPFDGFFQMSGAGIMPALHFASSPLVASRTQAYAVLMQDLVDLFASSIAAPDAVDPAAGVVLLTARDCSNQNASGVTFSIDPAGEAKPFYLLNAVPSSTAVETDADGYGGFVNVAPPSAEVTATANAVGEVVRSDTIIVRAGWATYIEMPPAP